MCTQVGTAYTSEHFCTSPLPQFDFFLLLVRFLALQIVETKEEHRHSACDEVKLETTTGTRRNKN